MTSRRALVLTVVAALAAGCAGRRPHHSSPQPERAPGIGTSGSGGADTSGLHSLAERGEKILEDLPWHPDVLRANLAANGPVALTQIYVMNEDVLAVSNTGRLFCLSKRDLTPRWISTLRSPLAAPPAESALHYVFLERDPVGAAYLQWFSRRSGAEADRSPARLPYAPSSGVSATASTAYVASLGSPNDNKTLETLNLTDGTPGWGYRTLGRVVATPTLDWAGDSVLVLSEDRTIVSLPANQAGSAPAQVNWQAETLAANSAAPAVVKDWAFVGSDDNFLRAYDSHSGEVKWMKGLDAPVRKSPWTLGTLVSKTVSTGGEGSTKARVEAFEGYVFARNSLGLHAFEATTGEDVFKDADAERPLVMVHDWVLTLDTAKQAQIRKGKGLPVVSTAAFGVFDFVPTNSHDAVVVAGLADGTILVAVPK